ncbi:MAG: threonine aldolase [Verrucomicrobiales bacterium]
MDHYAFGSDNVAGICPQAWQAMEAANSGDASPYGADVHTAHVCDRVREIFETDCDVYFVFNGTAANSLAISAICQSYNAVVCHEKSHLQTDECGAPEFFTRGAKLMTCPGKLAKLKPETVLEIVQKRRDLHFSKPSALSLTQATEFGTVYQPEEIAALTQTARTCDLKVHMDGARFANAAAHLSATPAELTWKAGVDVLSLGGTKLGGGIGDAVVFFDRELARDFDYRCKQAGQLASKMRCITAAWEGLLEGNTWLEIAARANAHAQTLAAGLREIEGIDILFPVEANAVFARFSPSINAALSAAGWHYYSLADIGDSRLMCSWRTTEDDVQAFLSAARQAATL